MNLRVRRVTGESESAIFAMLLLSCKIDDQAGRVCFWWDFSAQCGVFWTGCSDWVDLGKFRPVRVSPNQVVA